LTPENRDDRNGDFTGDSKVTPSLFMLYVLRFILLLYVNIFVHMWGENIKSPIPGLCELKIMGDIIDDPIRGLPRVLDYAINLT